MYNCRIDDDLMRLYR